MEDGILSLRWNNHRSTFFHILSTLHRKEVYSDVTLACNGKFFPVHKLVLSVCSEYFEDMFKQTTCKHPIIVLKDILPDELEALLNYMYAGEANVAQSDLARLIKAAECLRIKGLAVPDEGPQAAEGKRPSAEAGRDDHHHPKRRKHDEQHHASPSKTSGGRERGTVEERRTSDTDLRVEAQSLGRYSEQNSQQHTRDSSPQSGVLLEGHRSTREENNAMQDISEVVEEQPIIKEEVTEPKQEEEEEDEVRELAEDDLNFEALGSGGEDRGSTTGVNPYDPQMMSPHPQNLLQDIMGQGIPSTSAMSADSLSAWDSLSGFPLDGISSEDSRTSQAVGVRGSYRREKYGSSCGGASGEGLLGSRTDGGCYPCLLCQKQFTSRQDLRRHVRTHTGERPYQCPLCPHRAALKGNIKKHIIAVHKDLAHSSAEAAAVLDIEAFETSSSNLSTSSGVEVLQNSCALSPGTFNY